MKREPSLTWEESEPRLRDGLARAARKVRRAFGRRSRLFAVAFVCATLAFSGFRFRSPAYEGVARFRVVVDSDDSTENGLSTAFKESVFTSRVLRPIIKAQRLDVAPEPVAMDLAVRRLREQLQVGAVRWAGAATPERSAAVITLRYVSPSHDIAESVVRELSHHVLDASRARSSAKLEATTRGMAVARDLSSDESQHLSAVSTRVEKLLSAQLEQQDEAFEVQLLELTSRQSRGPMTSGYAALAAAIVSLVVTAAFALTTHAGHDVADDEEALVEAGLHPLGKVRLPRRA